ncbi:HBR137Wp [Eremothecium sinecaudum]|uniref:non-specific serine/threonine protein kinase n=1 Tax=Eremothecium sinecaudum TaxID=45286 RepID=A0A109UWV5_9SACH|nr:HBR137Wp [Eremothecium sinecaudum]AMD19038.1 HBR137Wp [Eremothecium sinecaudum]
MFASKVEQNNLKATIGASYNKLYGQFSSNELKEVGNYRLLKLIGEGSFGKVYLASHKPTHQKVVLKTGEKNDANIVREVFYHRQFDFPFITKLYEVIVTETKVWMALEYCPGNELYEYLLYKQRIPLEETKRLFAQIVSAVYYAHSLQCVHRDLKLENILLDRNGYAMLTDFGFTRECASKTQLETICGTTVYMAPELIKRETYDGYKVDTWSLGIILYTLLHGYMPFDEGDTSATSLKIMNNEPEIIDDYTNSASRDLIQQLLQKNPSFRPSLNEVLVHPFLQPYGAVLLDTIGSLIKKQRRANPNFQSKIEKRLLKKLKQSGFDTSSIKLSVMKKRCDSLCSLWYLLLEKEKKRELLKNPKRTRSLLSVRKAFDPTSGAASQDEVGGDKTNTLKKILSLRSEVSNRPPNPENITVSTFKESKIPVIPIRSQESVSSSMKSKINIFQKISQFFEKVKKQQLRRRDRRAINNNGAPSASGPKVNSKLGLNVSKKQVPKKLNQNPTDVEANAGLSRGSEHRLRGALTIVEEPNVKKFKSQSSGDASVQPSLITSEADGNTHSTSRANTAVKTRPSSLISQHSVMSNGTFNSEYSTDAQSGYKLSNSASARMSGSGQVNGSSTGDSTSLSKSKMFAKRAVSIMSSASSNSEMSSRTDSFYDITTASSPINLDIRANSNTLLSRVDSSFPRFGRVSTPSSWLPKREKNLLLRRARVNPRLVKRSKLTRANSSGTQYVIQEESSFSDGDGPAPIYTNNDAEYGPLGEQEEEAGEVVLQSNSATSSKSALPLYPLTLNSASKSGEYQIGRSYSDASEWSQTASYYAVERFSPKQSTGNDDDDHEEIGIADDEDNA